MRKNFFVSVVILNWNGRKFLQDCLDSILKLKTKYHYEIIVVDNGSTDGSIAMIEEFARKHSCQFASGTNQISSKKARRMPPIRLNSREPLIRLIVNQTNLGFAEANNQGFKIAGGDLILFLNNDTIVSSLFLDPLVKVISEDKTVAAVQPKILCYPQKGMIDSIGSYFLKTGFLYHYGHNKKDQEEYHQASAIFSMKGACMLFKKEVLAKIDVFDQDYFAYFEETDLCQRVWLSGYRILYVPRSEVYHRGGKTAEKLPSPFIQYHSYKNRIYTYLKNFEAVTLLGVMPKHIFLCQIASLAYLLTFKFSLAFSIQRALLWNLFNLKKVLKSRRKVNQVRIIRDRDYLPKLSRVVRLSYYYHLLATSLAGYQD